jgi:hypothetical protein
MAGLDLQQQIAGIEARDEGPSNDDFLNHWAAKTEEFLAPANKLGTGSGFAQLASVAQGEPSLDGLSGSEDLYA